MSDFLVVRLSRNEADAARQAFGDAIDYFFSPSTGCCKCILLGGGGCSTHSDFISYLRNLRNRFSFIYVGAAPARPPLQQYADVSGNAITGP